jgi:hypothetical protein
VALRSWGKVKNKVTIQDPMPQFLKTAVGSSIFTYNVNDLFLFLQITY